MWGWIKPLLEALLPWAFSGEKKTQVKSHEGAGGGLDRKPGNPDKRLNAQDLPKLAVVFGLALALPGCFGTRTTHSYHLVEPGGVVEVVTGRVKVRAPGTDDVDERYDPAGKADAQERLSRAARGLGEGIGRIRRIGRIRLSG